MEGEGWAWVAVLRSENCGVEWMMCLDGIKLWRKAKRRMGVNNFSSRTVKAVCFFVARGSGLHGLGQHKWPSDVHSCVERHW